MKKYKWLSKKLISGVLVSVILAVTASVGLGTSPMVAASSPPPETEWEKTFGGSSNDWGESVRQTADGGYIIAGITRSYGAVGQNVYLIKTDSLGNQEWYKAIGGGGEHAYSVQQTTDGGYIIVGETTTCGAGAFDVYLIKTDSLGNQEWYKTFGGSGWDHGYSVQQTTDGGYIVAGATESYGAGDDDVYLIKTDSLGNKEWDKTFGGSDWDNAYAVWQTTDGGYIVAGTTDSFGAGWEDVYLIKTDSLGNQEWYKTFGGSSDEYAYCIEQTTDGGYIMVGETRSYGAGSYDAYLIKTDSLGNQEWYKTFGGSGYEADFSVQQTMDGGYVIAGATDSFGAGGRDVYLIQTDASGNKEWEKTIGGSSHDFAYSVQQTTDGGYIMVGLTDSYGAGSYDVYLVKVCPLFNTPVGTDVTVSLPDGTVTFPSVQESGTTTMTTSTENPGGPTPSGFYVIEGNFVEITTTANYSGPVTVGISYDESQVVDEESLVLFHWNGSVWEDITTSVDTVENIVYGQVASLSSFFLGEPVVAPVADAGGPYLTQVDYSVDLDGSASYHPDGTIVSYDWSFGDNTTGTGVIVSHTYTAVGIYDVVLTVTDDKGVQASDTTMVVVYDPEVGSATGGGWFWSAKGNLKRDFESEGKATFGFVVKYKKEAAAGNLEFQYHVGDINLKDSNMTWLVVSSPNTNFQGEGTINGEGLYTFRVLAKDGAQAGGDPDEFTIKIWQGTDTEADPIYQALHAELGGGNIMIHDN